MSAARRTLLIRLIAASVAFGAPGCAHGVDPAGPSDGAAPASGGGLSGGGTGGAPNTSGSGAAGGGAASSGGASPGGTSSGGSSPGGTSSGGTSNGGAGTDAAGTGGGPVDPIIVGDLIAEYWTQMDNNRTVVKVRLRASTRGTKSVPLAELTLRYWYTADGTPSPATGYQLLQKDYYDIERLTSNRTTAVLSFGPVTPPQPGADTYIEVGFKGPDSIGPGVRSVDNQPMLSTNQIELEVHWPNYATMYDETNDYSYDGKKTAFTPWQKVTLYRRGVLVWGIEPDGTKPTGASFPDAAAPPSDAGPG